MTSRPTIFISSTIYDFEDLRGAIYDWLTLKGFRVLMSEHNDFDVAGDLNSYQTCFDAIRNSDFFLLLIGDKRGGLFDSRPPVISVTRQEYRVAFDASKTSNLPILTFVRKKTWDEKRLVEIGELKSDEQREHQVSFLQEVGRIEEMKLARDGKGEPPKNNWIYRFNSFSEIRSALEVRLELHQDLETKALRGAASIEIETLLSHFLIKTENTCFWPSDTARKVRTSRPIGKDDLTGEITFSREEVWSLFLPTMGSSKNFIQNFTALEKAQYWPSFYDFDPLNGQMSSSPMQDAIRKTILVIKQMSMQGDALKDARTAIINILNAAKKNSNISTFHLPTIHAVVLYSYFDELDRLQRYLAPLAAHFILNKPFIELGDADIPISPLTGANEDLEKERVTAFDVQKYIETLLGLK